MSNQKKLIENKEEITLKKSKDLIDPKVLKEIAESMDASVVEITNNESDDSFFKTVAKNLNNPALISQKTEYISIPENFNGTKLDFLAIYGNMPYLKQFIKIFETKRVSYQRKGRQEDVMLLQERRQEQQSEEMKKLGKLFGAT